MRLADERGDQRDREQHDQPRRVDESPAAKLTIVTTSCAWPNSWPISVDAPGGLAARALEPVLQLAVLEVLEVERRRMLHQPQAGRVAEALGQQRVEQRDDAAEHVGGDRERELEREQPADAVERAAVEPFAQRVVGCGVPREPHDLVDDQLADVERGDGQQRAHDAAARPGRASAQGWSARRASGTAAGCAARRGARAAVGAVGRATDRGHALD